MAKYDAIIIGSGNGALSCGLTLAQKGKKIAMFERHNIPGGCGTSFCRGRFEFEVALHQLNGMGSKENPGPLRKLFREWKIEDKIDWIPIDTLFKVNLPDGRGLAIPAEKEAIKTYLSKEFPNERENIIRYVDTVWKFNEEIGAFTAKAGASAGEPGALKKAIMKVGFPKMYPTLAKYGLMSSQAVLDEFFTSKELQLGLSAYWCFMGMPPTRFPFSILARCMYLYTIDKPYYLRGGSMMMSQAFVDGIREAGSDVFFNTTVKRILLNDRKEAYGIETSDGRIFEAKEIISNISPQMTYEGLLDGKDVPREAQEYLKGYTVGISALTCFIGLDCPPREIGFTDSFNLIYDSLDANGDYMNSYHLDSKVDPIVATCYTIDDPKVSPEGTSIITAGTLKYGEAWEKLTPEEYKAQKYRTADDIVTRLEKRFPGLRDHIEEMEIASPLTHMRYLKHPGGAIYGYEQDLKSSVFFYPQDEFIPHLHFSSGWVNTCGFGPNYEYGNKVAIKLLKEGF